MKKIKYVFVLIGFFLIGSANAQNYQQDYIKGKEFFKEKNYNLAMEAFKPLVSSESDSPFARYAMFYYALSAYNEGYPSLAKNMLLQIQELYPLWNQIDEVQLWLARIYFEDNRYNQGLYVLNNISNRKLAEKKDKILEYHLSQLDDKYLLGELYKSHNDNELIAKRYLQVLTSEPAMEQDRKEIQGLIAKFNFDPEKFDASIVTKTVFKDEYKVAVMFPFVYETLDVSLRRKKNQFVLDIYEGIRMAVDSLSRKGIDINLYAYDTKRQRQATEEILDKEELKSMDLIIGPLFPGPLEAVQQFSYDHKINMLNPLSNNPEVVGNNPYSFLFMPSYQTLGKAIGDLAREEAENPYGIIFYGESTADSTLAYSYKEAFEKDSINEIIMVEKIYSGDERRILDILTARGAKLKDSDDVKLTIPKDSIGSIYVASDEGLIITRVLSAIETRSDEIKVYGSEKWLDIKAIDYEALERLEVALTSPNFMDYRNPKYLNFREKYILKHKQVPSEFATLGFDMMLFSGHILENYGKYFQLALAGEETIEGTVFTGYNYSRGNNNQVVPIVRVVDNEPRILVIKNYANNEQE